MSRVVLRQNPASSSVARMVLVLSTLGGPACDTDKPLAESAAHASGHPGTPVVMGLEGAAAEPGQRAAARDYYMTVLEHKRCPLEPHFAPRRGHSSFGVKVRLEGRSTRQVPVNPFYATLQTSRGTRVEAILGGCQPALPALQLEEQRPPAEGWITFEVPEGELSGLELRYSPVVIGVGTEELHFSVTP